jgi:hypothetical protein
VIAALLAMQAFAAECEPPAAVPDRASVVWVAPAGRRVGAARALDVVRTADVRSWAARNGDGATVGGLLRWMGERRRPTEPKRAWMVVVFDVDTAVLCRPMGEAEAAPGEVVAGLPACEKPGPIGKDDEGGCGARLTSEGTQGPDAFRVAWRDAVTDGFCVVPLERFLRGT